ncbi:hypothetical protein HanIR_Chr04g0154231 [Helianthus annuus]|nr:hypothetical protein HanIR_Chr04g0154211 [Helianthus annuus]KAJ0586651.1 hypothetical protein HanIR_Chr04g0154231 [Helianthus annuus]
MCQKRQNDLLRVMSVLGEKAPLPCLDSVEERVELKTTVLNQLAYDMLHLVADGQGYETCDMLQLAVAQEPVTMYCVSTVSQFM